MMFTTYGSITSLPGGATAGFRVGGGGSGAGREEDRHGNSRGNASGARWMRLAAPSLAHCERRPLNFPDRGLNRRADEDRHAPLRLRRVFQHLSLQSRGGQLFCHIEF